MANKMTIKSGSKKVTLTKKQCGTKAEMKRAAERARDKGKYTRVVKDGRKHCLLTGGKRKKTKRKTTATKRKSTARKTTKRKSTKRKTTRRRTSSSRGNDLLGLRD